MTVAVAIIAAVAANGVIGNGNAIPWHLPTDFAHFKRMTIGKPLIMGRKTFEAIGRPLPGRANIIVTRQPGYQVAGATVVQTLEEGLTLGQSIAARDRANEVMIGGGAEIYAQALPIADRMYITHVGAAPDGDAHFPTVNMQDWRESGIIDVPPNPNDTAAFRIKVYRRAPNSRR